MEGLTAPIIITLTFITTVLSIRTTYTSARVERRIDEIAHDVYSTSRGCRDIPYFLGQVEYLVEYLSRQQTDESASVSRFKQRLKRL
jgi:hypothetical protein